MDLELKTLRYFIKVVETGSITGAAKQLGISQPAMSNGLRRLRTLFDDPLLIRTSEGMTPTERAGQLEPMLRTVLQDIERAIQPRSDFDAENSQRVFRIMVSDYAESTLVPPLLRRLREEAPNVILDLMTPSDVSFLDVEQGKVDMVINRFDDIPQSFHQTIVWRDEFCCMVSSDNPILENFSLKNYLQAQHVWVSKTGYGVGVGVDPADVQRLGWVDEVLGQLGSKRNITTLINQSTARLKLPVSRLQPNSRGEIQVRLENAVFDDILKWLHAMEYREGLLVREVSITQAGTKGRVNATVRMAQAG